MTTRPEKTSKPARLSRAASSDAPPLAGVILCGGSGTRMGRTHAHKVCEPIAGRPAIVRLVDTLRGEGVDPIVVVVGHRAGDVVQTIGAAHPGVMFVFQRDRLGTGHAARIAIDVLHQVGFDGRVLITMGDKWFAPGLIDGAKAKFDQADADLLLVTTPKRAESGAGRLVRRRGRGLVGIVERRDIERARVLADWLAMAERGKTLTKAGLRRAGLKRIRPARKLWRALGPLAGYCRGTGAVQSAELAQVLRETGLEIAVGPCRMGPEDVEKNSTTVNESVYIGKLGIVRRALRRVGRTNAQDEYYLTDIVEILARGAVPSAEGSNAKKSLPCIIEHPLTCDDVMAFNTRAELRRIEEHVANIERRDDALLSPAVRKRLGRQIRTPDQWRALLDPKTRRGTRMIERTYGREDLVQGRRGALRRVVRLFEQEYGDDRKCLLVRGPGRVNLMGRHIDHQGGYVHSMALDCEVIMAASPRSDDVIRLVNADRVTFPPRELVLGDWRPALRSGDWLSVVDGDAVRSHLLGNAGDWSNYVLAAAVYLQHTYPDRRIRGMDVLVAGNVPMAAGLSSSSAVVVSAMEALAAINGLNLSGSDVVSACGQAEWFVGSRGGAADHAAIRLGRAGQAARMGFHPFRLSRYVPVPDEAAILLAYSGEHAVKSAGARDRFNERVACYRLGIELLKRDHPRLASRLEHIRDVSPNRLKIPAEKVRQMVVSLPDVITRAQLRRRLGPRSQAILDRVFAAHADPGKYTVRDVVAYGVGECERSRVAAELLDDGNLEGFGELMLLSHDGDRTSGKFGSSGQVLAAKATPLTHMVGAYACSTRGLDELVDLARGVPGVYGAQLAGAGLGGCVMILARRGAVGRVKKALTQGYYEPRAMASAIWFVRSVAGGGLIQP